MKTYSDAEILQAYQVYSRQYDKSSRQLKSNVPYRDKMDWEVFRADFYANKADNPKLSATRMSEALAKRDVYSITTAQAKMYYNITTKAAEKIRSRMTETQYVKALREGRIVTKEDIEKNQRAIEKAIAEEKKPPKTITGLMQKDLNIIERRKAAFGAEYKEWRAENPEADWHEEIAYLKKKYWGYD